MTSEYSIELQAENINNIKTKQYFQEVLSSYINGNYRSAIVVLWTVTVCDLIYKLQDLSSIYDDTVAEKILEEISQKQEENKKSPEWESDLIKKLEEKTTMFATYEITQIKFLHQQRHLSAHPIIKEDLDLYQPNKENVRALIRNILESVLTKPSMASKKIFMNLIKDLEEKRELFPNTKDLENYILSKYYKHTPDKVKQYIFKQLWKFIFKLDNEDINKNRSINFKALVILYKNNIEIIKQIMRDEQEYFASSINLDSYIAIKYFVSLCSKYPKMYEMIEDNHKPPILEKIKLNKTLWSKSFFIHIDISGYLSSLETEIGLEEIVNDIELSKEIINFCQENGSLGNLINLYIDGYTNSHSFDNADKSFDSLIEPILSYMDKNQFVNLLEKIEKNDQVYSRRGACFDHSEIMEKCNKKYTSFDYTPYEIFLESIEK